MDQQLTLQDILFFTIYGGVTLTAMIACHYLLLRRANAFEPEITSPVRLRRWTAAFFATLAASHIWWLSLYYIGPYNNHFMGVIVCLLLDCVTVFPTLLCTMQAMLQDRRRSYWPVAAVVFFSLIYLAVANAFGNSHPKMVLLIFLALLLFVFVMMARAVRQYGRWLRENYAELEHKEVWQNFLLLVVFMINTFVYHSLEIDILNEIFMQLLELILIFLLLWRVEVLQTLDKPVSHTDKSTTVDSV